MKIKSVKIKDELQTDDEKQYLYICEDNYDSLCIGIADEDISRERRAIIITKNKNIDKIIAVLKSYKKQNKRWK